MPLDRYVDTPDRWHLVDHAINLLGRTCMRRLGVQWSVVAPPPGEGSAVNARRYGVLDPGEVRRWGYHLPSTGDDPPHRPRPTLSAEQAAAWVSDGTATVNGKPVPTGGCAGEAMRTLLAGSPPAPDLEPQRLAREALTRSEHDSRVRAAFDAWSSCMRTAGYRYTSPWEANDDPRWRTARPTPREVATARADVLCRERTNLVGLWYAVEKAYQSRIVEQHAGEFAVLDEIRKVLVSNSTRVVAAHSRPRR